MRFINHLFERFFPTPQRLSPGIYHYQAPQADPRNYRLHLRLAKNGQGILIVNASTVLHLNETAAEFAYHIIRQTPQNEVAERVSRRYNVAKAQALQDFRELHEKLEVMIETPDLDPVSFLDIDRQDPYTDLVAPYRMVCAVTYQTMGVDAIGVAPTDRVKRELSLEEWHTVLQKAWDAGIPHVIFTGGEPTLRKDLVDLILHAEKLGQVTGILTNGNRLSESDYLQQLLQSGLDHVMVLLDPHDKLAWVGLESVLAEDIYTAVHLTITSANITETKALIGRLSGMGVSAVSLSAIDPALKDTLDATHTIVAEAGMELVWDVPVPYSKNNPVALELINNDSPPDSARQAWIYVEPDGDVLPAQGAKSIMGNLLTDPWETIWQNR
ncbi:MAG TPA: radical SAM protein [Levilinea sp.]|nr:radical SAM protein [Levilinea sp.]